MKTLPILRRSPGDHRVIESGEWNIVARAKVDPEDFDEASRELWRLEKSGYPYTTIGGRPILLQRFIWLLRNPQSEDVFVYTRNLDPLDCRRKNLFAKPIKPLKPVMA